MQKATSAFAVTPVFSSLERDRRWNMSRAFMESRNIDALLVFGEHEDAGPAPFCLDTWFTNDRAGTTILFPKSGEPSMFVPMKNFILDHIAALQRGDNLWISEKNVLLGSTSVEILDEFRKLGLDKGVIGVIGLEPYIPWHPEGIVPFNLWNSLLTQLPKVKFRPVGLEFARRMMPLSQEEIAVVRHSAQIGDAMVRAMVEAARPGVFESEVYAAGVHAALTRGTVVPGMLIQSGPALITSGPPPWSYRPQAPRILRDGDYIAAEVFSGFGMHHTQHQVAISIGKVDEAVERAAVVARACYEAGLAALRAKRPFAEVAEAMLKPVEAVGGWVRGPQAHGMNPYGSISRILPGLEQVGGADRYPAVPETPTVPDDLLLEAGMTFAFEPSCGFGNTLVTLGGTVIVGEQEAIELNPYTAQLLRAEA